jgi:transposase
MGKRRLDARRLPPAAQEDLRRRVVRAVREQGLSKVQAAETFGVSRASIHTWVKAVADGGEAALRARKRGPKPHCRLAGHQAATVVRLIEDRCPDQLRLPFALWTREAVQQLIARRYGIRLSVWTVGRYLRRWGFTAQKPLRRAYEQDPVAVRRWLAEQYPAIRQQAKREKAEMYWGDEMGLRSDHQAGTSYGRRGQTPTVPGTGRRFGCQMVSAITNRGHLLFLVYKQRFTSRVFLGFLRRLVRQVGRRAFLIVDGHPVHRSAEVKRWVVAHARHLRLFYLPWYSPELNPDELLNQDVKSNALGRRRPQDQQELMDTVRSYLHSTQKQPHIVRSYFHEETVRYAALQPVSNEYRSR